jgi:hypothetical protein
MLIVLPLLAFVVLFLTVGNRDQGAWARAALRAAILWGVYAIASAELLGVVGWITPLGLALAWAIPIAAGGWFLASRARRGEKLDYPRPRAPQGWLNRLLLAGILAIFFVTGFLGVVTPPQSNDSLGYHLARVAHWAQDGSLRHFATGIEVQNSMSPGGDVFVLHTYVLTGGDWSANGVQWAAMILTVIAAGILARQLGGGETAGWVAAAFAASLPMGIAEASNTMMDSVTAFWVIAAACETMGLFVAEEASSWKANIGYLSVSAGMTLLTKGSGIPFLAPFGLAVGGFLLRRVPRRDTLRWGLAGIALVVIPNAGYLTRNLLTFGEPFGPYLVMSQRNELLTLRGVASILVRNAALHAGTPWSEVNELVFRGVAAFHSKIGLDVNDPRTTGWGYFAVSRPSTHEAGAGNPAHAALSLVLFGLLLARPRKFGGRALVYGLGVAAGFILFSAVFKWQIWGSRLHLPFFILLAPLCGFVLERALPARIAQLIGLALIVLSWPWLTGISTRPLLSGPGGSGSPSVLLQSREDLYYANVPWAVEGYQAVIRRVSASGCSDVGLVLSGSAMEYLIWAGLGAPRDDLRIEWFVSGTPSARYEASTFSPCAVICEGCPTDWTVIRGLPLMEQHESVWLFMNDDE